MIKDVLRQEAQPPQHTPVHLFLQHLPFSGFPLDRKRQCRFDGAEDMVQRIVNAPSPLTRRIKLRARDG